MSNQDKLVESCKRLIETKLGWGSPELWTNQDYERLSMRILDETRVNLSPATLKRIWGKVRYDSKPTVTTLDTLARFAGYESWRIFALQVLSAKVLESEMPQTEKPLDKRFYFGKKEVITFGALAIMLLVGLLFYGFRKKFPQEHQKANAAAFTFSSKKLVTEGVPNTVIFNYDASSARVTDTIYIQQSWDPRLREQVSAADHQHTSIYYHPGFFAAKLIVNDQIVKEHSLFIQTKGWLPMVDLKPVPVYFKESDLKMKGRLRLPLEKLIEYNIPMQPLPPFVCYYKVDEFSGLSSDSLVFETSLKNEYSEGAAACQHTEVHLLFEGSALIIPLSAKGCVSELTFLDKEGTKNDLSILGVDFLKWTKVKVEMINGTGTLYINDQHAFTFEWMMPSSKVVGMQYRFQGTGSVNQVKLSYPDGRVIYEEAFY
jgi:hypothetical protein